MKFRNWVAALTACSVVAISAPVSAQFGGLGALKKKLESSVKDLEKPKSQPLSSETPSYMSRPAASKGSDTAPQSPSSSPAPLPKVPIEQGTNLEAAQVSSDPAQAKSQMSLLGTWLPNDTEPMEENHKTITRDSIDGYEDGCTLSPPISNDRVYEGQETCALHAESEGGGERDTGRIRLELIDDNTLSYTQQGSPRREYWKRVDKQDSQAPVAKCHISNSSGQSFQGPCDFSSLEQGSFTVSPQHKGSSILGATELTVWIVEPGVAEVRGLTSSGINSRWGEARRSTSDKACWIGSDFKICVY